MVTKKTYAEAIVEKYQGKRVEIYIGDDRGSLHYADEDVSQKVSIKGVVKEAFGDLLTLIVSVSTAAGEYTTEVDIHSWAVKGIMLQNKNISILNVFGNQQARKLKR